jgi:hypothetical protein
VLSKTQAKEHKMPKVNSVKAVVTPPVVTKKTSNQNSNMAMVVAQNLGLQKVEVQPVKENFAMTLMYHFGLTIVEKKP